jgi:hypothetical protein
MADRWWGMLDIPDAPAEWTRAVRLPMHDGGTYTAYDLAIDAMPEDVGRAFDELNLSDVERDPDGHLRIEDAELAGGSYAFSEHGLLAALKDAGVAFSAYDDGDCGNPGIYFFWHPGLDAIQERTYAAETGVVIDVGRLRIIFAAADFTPPEPLAQALRDYFDLKPDDDLTPRKEVNA